MSRTLIRFRHQCNCPFCPCNDSEPTPKELVEKIFADIYRRRAEEGRFDDTAVRDLVGRSTSKG
jgi:hypothetical protein